MTTSNDTTENVTSPGTTAFPNGELERDVRAFIASNFIVDDGAAGLASDESLTQSGVLDSMGVLELIMYLEERYGFRVPDEDTLPENLDSVGRIVNYIERRLADRGRGA